MKYAHLERERRFLLDVLPDVSGARVLTITDRYVESSRLRLRLVEEEGKPPVRKLGQKIRLDGTSTHAHTTLYLDEEEFALLATLPARTLSKTRYLLGEWAVDVLASGLLLAESETAEVPPFPVVREVTAERAFTGGSLAT
jgi:hypothetical protein